MNYRAVEVFYTLSGEGRHATHCGVSPCCRHPQWMLNRSTHKFLQIV